ncbi:hypothetical protein B0H13DRAFT_1599019, partial [Mycena leptocephala]
PRLFSPNLLALRRRLQSTEVEKIFAVDCTSNNSSTYRHDTDFSMLAHGDSLPASPSTNILPISQWFLNGTGYNIPVEIRAQGMSQQSAGSRSCGIAALNFIESAITVGVDKWTNSTSHIFHRRALRDLVVYHVTAITQGFDSVGCILFSNEAESSCQCVCRRFC